MEDSLSLVNGLNPFSVDLICLCVSLGLSDHVLDLVLAKTSTGLDDDLLLLASSLVPGVDIHDAVGVNVEGNLNLGHTSGCWGNTSQLELPQQLVVSGHLSLALVNLHLHLGLAVSG